MAPGKSDTLIVFLTKIIEKYIIYTIHENNGGGITMESIAERRKVLRADINVFINEERETGAIIIARATDISPQGLHYIKPIQNTIEPKSDVKVEFILPDEEPPICAKGRVVHAGEEDEIQEFGIVFTWISSSDSERIRRYVLKRKQAELFDVLHQLHVAALNS